MSGGRTNGKIKRRFCSYGFIYYRGWSSFDRRDSTPRREERSLAGDLCDVAYFRTGTYQNIPDISDVNNQIRLLEDVGVKVTRNAPGDFTFQADEVNMEYVQSDEFLARCTKLRGSVMLIGPMIARFGRAMVAKPGGDKIGRRRLDTHFLGIQKLGAKFDYDIRRGVYDIHAGRLCGTYMLLDEASVTGTANIIMASVLAMGTTTIYNAACEPYIQQLCHLLNRMGRTSAE